MPDIFNDPSAVVEAAIQNELEGQAVLIRGKESATDPLAKATYEFLANEEIKHIELIEEYAASLAGTKEWHPKHMDGIDLPEAAKKIRGIFERFGTAFEAAGATDNQRLETYKVAMDMERRGHDFYSKAAETATNEDAKKLFRFLAGEEAKHFQMIQDTHDFLDNPDAILALEERWMQI